MASTSAALVGGVAQALTWAINDPLGLFSWQDNPCRPPASRNFGAQRPRSEKDTLRAASVFDSSAIPPISIEKYLMRLSATFRCCDASFISALIVVERLLSYDGGRLPLTMRNVHRIFLTSLVVAVKYHEDRIYSNSHYAKAGGVFLREVNRLERVLLMVLDFDLRIAPEQYRLYEHSLFAVCATHSLNASLTCHVANAGSAKIVPYGGVPVPIKKVANEPSARKDKEPVAADVASYPCRR